jgi:uncharacterized phage-associated protein
MKNNLKLKQLNLNPLSVAKYFYEKGFEDYGLIQNFLYLTYREVLKKENKILFKEKFQAWEDGPMLESVYQQMRYHFKEHRTLDCLFETVEDIKDKTIKSYLTKTYRDYQNSKKKGKQIEFFFQTQDVPWERFQENANGEKRPHIFMEPSKIIALVN